MFKQWCFGKFPAYTPISMHLHGTILQTLQQKAEKKGNQLLQFIFQHLCRTWTKAEFFKGIEEHLSLQNLLICSSPGFLEKLSPLCQYLKHLSFLLYLMEFSCLVLISLSEVHRQKNIGFQTLLASTQPNHTTKPQLSLLLLTQREASSEIVIVLTYRVWPARVDLSQQFETFYTYTILYRLALALYH